MLFEYMHLSGMLHLPGLYPQDISPSSLLNDADRAKNLCQLSIPKGVCKIVSYPYYSSVYIENEQFGYETVWLAGVCV